MNEAMAKRIKPTKNKGKGGKIIRGNKQFQTAAVEVSLGTSLGLSEDACKLVSHHWAFSFSLYCHLPFSFKLCSCKCFKRLKAHSVRVLLPVGWEQASIPVCITPY